MTFGQILDADLPTLLTYLRQYRESRQSAACWLLLGVFFSALMQHGYTLSLAPVPIDEGDHWRVRGDGVGAGESRGTD